MLFRSKQSMLTIEIFYTTAWMIWRNRNNAWLNNPLIPATFLSSNAISYAEEYLVVNSKMESSRSVSIPKWQPPSGSSVKMNVAWQHMKARQSFRVGAVI